MCNKTKHLVKGYVQIYTGNCKGKTTAALGLAFRAMGSGLRTYIGQFMKGQQYGELYAAKKVKPYIIIEQYGKKGLLHIQNPPQQEDVDMAREGLQKARLAMKNGGYSIVVFDEIITAHYFHLVSLSDMLDIIKDKPANVEIVLTGRYAPKELIDAADLVTEMVEVKHYYQQGVNARDGIEH
jgi:cob(I)alamin adenosyltransferase